MVINISQTTKIIQFLSHFFSLGFRMLCEQFKDNGTKLLDFFVFFLIWKFNLASTTTTATTTSTTQTTSNLPTIIPSSSTTMTTTKQWMQLCDACEVCCGEAAQVRFLIMGFFCVWLKLIGFFSVTDYDFEGEFVYFLGDFFVLI